MDLNGPASGHELLMRVATVVSTGLERVPKSLLMARQVYFLGFWDSVQEYHNRGSDPCTGSISLSAITERSLEVES